MKVHVCSGYEDLRMFRLITRHLKVCNRHPAEINVALARVRSRRAYKSNKNATLESAPFALSGACVSCMWLFCIFSNFVELQEYCMRHFTDIAAFIVAQIKQRT